MATIFQKKIELLNKRFEVVELSRLPLEINPHLDMVQDFESRIVGKDGKEYVTSLEDYITGYYEEKDYYLPYNGDFLHFVEREFVWPAKLDNDANHNRIFLVIDKEARKNEAREPNPQIAFYFGLSSGLMIDVPEKTASKAEDTLVDSFIQAANIEDETIREQLTDELYQSVRNIYGAGETKRLMAIAKKENAMYVDRMLARESENQTIQSQKTYPAMELTHFARNLRYQTPVEMDEFSLGEYVFWEIIMGKIEKIKAETGLQYLYLFAADPKMEGNPLDEQEIDELAHSMDFPEEVMKKMRDNISGKLISYYRNRFGFRIVDGVRLVKPNYDFGCYSMYASLDTLELNKISNWDSLDTEAKNGGGKNRKVR